MKNRKTEILIIPDITKTECKYIVLKKITTNALSQRSQFIFKHLKMYNRLYKTIKCRKVKCISKKVSLNLYLQVICHLGGSMKRIEKPFFAVRELDIALGNHALLAQPTDYSLICRYRLVNNL